MEIKRGIAKKVRTRNMGRSTTILFEIDGNEIKFSNYESTTINENDEIIVSGEVKGNTFDVYAYKNLTTNMSVKGGVLNIVIAVVFIFATIIPLAMTNQYYEILGYPDYDDKGLLTIFAVIIVGFGVFFLNKGFKELKASSLLENVDL